MLTLVFDTCFNKTYIVLKNDNKILNSLVINSTDVNYHSVYLIPKIKDLLKEHNLLIKDIDVIGVNVGPGSFTGIRAGITIARVLCQRADIKLIGVESLRILSKIANGDVVVILDARKNKVYYAEYSDSEVKIAPCLVSKDDLIEKIINRNIKVISDKSIGEFLALNAIQYIDYEDNDDNLGVYLSEITDKIFAESNDDLHWAKIKPLYIQPPSISKPKELKNV